MFKKSKKSNKNLTPPAAPSLDEVLADIETFHIDTDHTISHNKTTDVSTNTMDSWWKVFEQFIDDLKCLEMVHSEMESFKTKLKSLKQEVDTDAKLLKQEIDQQQQQIDVALQ